MHAITSEVWRGETLVDESPASSFDTRWNSANPAPRTRDWDAANDRIGLGIGDALQIEPTAFEQILRKTRSVALCRYRCPIEQRQFSFGDGPAACTYIVFHRSSMKLKSGDGRCEIVTPNHVSFIHAGQTFTRESIGGEGDHCERIAISPAWLRNILAMKSSIPADAMESLLAHPCVPIGPQIFLAQRKLFASVSQSPTTMSSQQLDQAVASLLEDIAIEALEFRSLQRRSRRLPRPTCQRRRLQIIEDAKALLARNYRSDLSLAALAHQLHCSAAHLSRLFPATTGFKLNDYRQELRLRNGLFLLEDSGLDIGDIALHLGFASHSHFSSAFNRHFGMSPSEYLKWKFTGGKTRAARGFSHRAIAAEHPRAS